MEWFGGCRGIGWSALEGEPWHLGWGWGWGWEVGVVYRTSFLSVSVQKPCLSSLSMQWSQWFPSCRYSLCNLTETAFYTCHTFSLAPCPVFLLPCSIRSRHVHLGTVSNVSLTVRYQIKTRPSWHRVQSFSYRALSDQDTSILAPCPEFLLSCSIRSRHVHLGTVSSVSLTVLYQITD